ncbi:MAG: hypothetical protein ABI318_05840 [Chthoniobacteraceae bacterium]
MKIERLRELRNARPFVPFQIRRKSGEPILVTNPDTMRVGPGDNWVFVSLPNDALTRISTNDLIGAEVIGFPTPEDSEFL